MRIGITCYPTYGGSGVVATELGKALAARGHEVHFIAYALPLRLAHVTERLYFHEVRVNTYPLFEYPPYSLALTSKMIDVVKYEKLDLLHVHYAIPHATSAVLARQILACEGIHIPVATTLHGTDITIVGQDPSLRARRRRTPSTPRTASRPSATTSAARRTPRSTCERPIEVIPNFVDTERFHRQQKGHFKQAIAPERREAARPRLQLPRGQARHRRRPGLPPAPRGDGPEATAHGSRAASSCCSSATGRTGRRAEALARELGVYSDVRFLGKQEPVEEILSIADVFLMPSGSETFGLAALEAMACGVPVVSSDIGGLPELNVDGETGFLRPLADIDCLAERHAPHPPRRRPPRADERRRPPPRRRRVRHRAHRAAVRGLLSADDRDRPRPPRARRRLRLRHEHHRPTA